MRLSPQKARPVSKIKHPFKSEDDPNIEKSIDEWDPKFNIPSNPADLMHIDFLKNVIEVQKEQIKELTKTKE